MTQSSKDANISIKKIFKKHRVKVYKGINGFISAVEAVRLKSKSDAMKVLHLLAEV